MENLFQSTQIATIFLDRNLVIRSFTPAVTRIFSLIPSDRGRPLTDIVSRLDHQNLEADMRAVFASGETIERSVTLAGDNGYYLARILPYRGNDNEIDGVVVTFVDITNILAAEEQQKVLAAELSHRVKNSLAVVSSIAERTLEDGESKDCFVSRLHALAQTHELLSRTQWTEASLRDLILAELSPHAVGDGDNVRVSGPLVLLKPRAARLLVTALKAEVGLPIHLHTHDTSGIASGSILAAGLAGVDAVDLAMDSMSGLTSQPCLGSVVEALRHDERDTGLDAGVICDLSVYWEAVRAQYAAFESDLKAGASEVYLHEMPGGQFTNLKEQARSLGLDSRWHEVARAYRAANDLFGDIVKVTPSSKVVGDMALMMVSQDLSPADVLDPDREIAFPASVVEMLHGDLGQPPGGWPEALQRKALKGAEPIRVRPGSLLPDADLDAERAKVGRIRGEPASEQDLASYLMYPKVFSDFAGTSRKYGPVSILPTPVYFYGMPIGSEITATLERGKSLVVRLQAVGEVDEEGQRRVFFELNGQPRIVRVPDRGAVASLPARRKAEEGNDAHLAAPMSGSVSTVAVQQGQSVKAGDVLLTIEAMKMEMALRSARDGTVSQVLVQAGSLIEAKDLLMTLV